MAFLCVQFASERVCTRSRRISHLSASTQRLTSGLTSLYLMWTQTKSECQAVNVLRKQREVNWMTTIVFSLNIYIDDYLVLNVKSVFTLSVTGLSLEKHWASPKHFRYAASPSWFCSTTWFTRPNRKASRALNRREVKSSSLARAGPISLGRLCVPPRSWNQEHNNYLALIAKSKY